MVWTAIRINQHCATKRGECSCHSSLWYREYKAGKTGFAIMLQEAVRHSLRTWFRFLKSFLHVILSAKMSNETTVNTV